MITDRRVAAVEASLTPLELVVRWIGEVQAFPTLEDYARSTLDLPDADSPLNRIGRSAEAAARAAMKGQPREEVERAARRAVGDALFLFCLVIEVNRAAVELALLHGLRAAGITFWMGALLGGPRGEAGEPLASDEAVAWTKWFATLDGLLAEVAVEVAAWQSLEQRYLGGATCLFTDAHGAWAALEDQVEHLERLAEMLRSGPFGEIAAKPGHEPSDAAADTDGDRRARYLADNARVTALELMGERPRAASIMARRLRLPDVES